MVTSTSPPLKSVSLQPGIVYGPVHSRRLGLSLGINLLPSDYKLCSFNCLYCQCGWTIRPTLGPTNETLGLPKAQEIEGALEMSLQQMARQKAKLKSITFSGNGEPTLHPELAEIVEKVKGLRDRYYPETPIGILSNSSTVTRPEVRAALNQLDQRMMKLDAGSEELIHQLNGPAMPFYLGEIVAGLRQLKDVILQSLFVRGRATNSDPDSVVLWVEKVREIRPTLVHIYTLDRVPADKRIEKVNMATLQWIARQVRWQAGVNAEVY